MAVHSKQYCNTYGSLAAYIVAFYTLIAGGELLYLTCGQWYTSLDWTVKNILFPFRTTAMLCSLFTLVFVPYGLQSAYYYNYVHYWNYCIISIGIHTPNIYGQCYTKFMVGGGVREKNYSLYVYQIYLPTIHFFSKFYPKFR